MAKPSNVKIIDFKADLKNVLVNWLMAGTMGRRQQDHSTDRPRPGRNRT